MDDLDNVKINYANIDFRKIIKIKKFSSIDSDIQMLNDYLDTGEWVLLSVTSGVYSDGEAYHSFILGRERQMYEIMGITKEEYNKLGAPFGEPDWLKEEN